MRGRDVLHVQKALVICEENVARIAEVVVAAADGVEIESRSRGHAIAQMIGHRIKSLCTLGADR